MKTCPDCHGIGYFVVPVPAEYKHFPARTSPPPIAYEPIETMQKRCQGCWGKGVVKDA